MNDLTEGREYDKKGNLQEWWQHSTILKFQERMKCFEEQYSKFQIGKDNVILYTFSPEEISICFEFVN